MNTPGLVFATKLFPKAEFDRIVGFVPTLTEDEFLKRLRTCSDMTQLVLGKLAADELENGTSDDERTEHLKTLLARLGIVAGEKEDGKEAAQSQ